MIKKVTAVLLGTALVALFFGCDVNPSKVENENFQVSDGNAGSIALEINAMGNVTLGALGLPIADNPQRSPYEDTLDLTLDIEPWHYDSVLKSWLRSEIAAGMNMEFKRYDTVTFYDEANEPVKIPKLSTLGKYRHIRASEGFLKKSFKNRYDMTVTIEKGTTDTCFIWNGSVSGTYGTYQHSTTVTDVKRKLMHVANTPLCYLSYPQSGTIFIDLPYKTISIEFNGGLTAKATITRKSDGKTWVVVINILTGKESIIS